MRSIEDQRSELNAIKEERFRRGYRDNKDVLFEILLDIKELLMPSKLETFTHILSLLIVGAVVWMLLFSGGA